LIGFYECARASNPIAVNTDGTLSRITNWSSLSEQERVVAAKRVAARNKERLAVLQRAEAAGGAPTLLDGGGVAVGVPPLAAPAATTGDVPSAAPAEAATADRPDGSAAAATAES